MGYTRHSLGMMYETAVRLLQETFITQQVFISKFHLKVTNTVVLILPNSHIFLSGEYETLQIQISHN